MKKSTDNWLKIAERDLKMANMCYKEGEPLGMVFHMHAAIEKLLKGICQELIGDPPKIHSLKKLAVDVCKIDLEKKRINVLSLLDTAFIDSRYPEDIDDFDKKYNLDKCKIFLAETKELYKCLRDLIIKN